MNAVRFTLHALERMEQRNVTPPMVEAVLRCGTRQPDLDGNGERATLLGFTVVLDPANSTVVTVFDRRNPSARFSPKRVSRLPGQHKRRIERDRTNNGVW